MKAEKIDRAADRGYSSGWVDGVNSYYYALNDNKLEIPCKLFADKEYLKSKDRLKIYQTHLKHRYFFMQSPKEKRFWSYIMLGMVSYGLYTYIDDLEKNQKE